jgi:hypothetical protein
MKAYGENGGMAPLILNLGIRCRWVVSFIAGQEPLYPLNGCWVDSRAGPDVLEKR